MDEVFSDGGAPGCAFVKVERQNFPEPRSLFGAGAPVLTARRLTFHSGISQDDDVIEGPEIISFLMTDEAFSGAIFGNGPYANHMTLDRFRGVTVPAYEDDIDARIIGAMEAGLRGESRIEMLQKACADLESAAKSGRIGKVAAADIASTLTSQTYNFFKDAEHHAESAIGALQGRSFSRRMSMAAAVANHEGIIEARHTALLEGPSGPEDHDDAMLAAILGKGDPRSRETLGKICGEVLRAHMGADYEKVFRSENVRISLMKDPDTPEIVLEAIRLKPTFSEEYTNADPREFVIQGNPVSGMRNMHSDLPHHGSVIGLEIGTMMPLSESRGISRPNLGRQVMKFHVTSQEMIMAIEGGQVGMSSRCTLSRVTGYGHLEPTFPEFWKTIEDSGVDTEFTDRIPAKAEAKDLMEKASRILQSGPGAPGLREAFSLASRAISTIIETVPDVERHAKDSFHHAEEVVDHNMMKSVARSDILERWQGLRIALEAQPQDPDDREPS